MGSIRARKKQEFRDKFAENYDKAKALEQAKVQGAKRAHATVSKEQTVAAKQLFQDQLQEHYKAAEAQFFFWLSWKSFSHSPRPIQLQEDVQPSRV